LRIARARGNQGRASHATIGSSDGDGTRLLLGTTAASGSAYRPVGPVGYLTVDLRWARATCVGIARLRSRREAAITWLTTKRSRHHHGASAHLNATVTLGTASAVLCRPRTEHTVHRGGRGTRLHVARLRHHQVNASLAAIGGRRGDRSRLLLHTDQSKDHPLVTQSTGRLPQG